jgi:gas vesicle protein
MSDRDDFGAFVSGFMIGGLVGAAVALLLAPQSGEETRTLIRDKSIELRDQVEQTATEARTRAEEIAQEARTKAEDLQSRGRVVLEEQKTRIEKAVDAGKKAAKDKKEELEAEA